ncbi:MAG: dihydrofolate reductase family protein [Nitrososphaerales archaeon]
MQISVDGYIARPNGELDWLTWNWDNKLKGYVNDLHEPVDMILLGRKMADGFISHWAAVVTKPDEPNFALGKKMVETPKVVFTKTLNESKWENTVVAKGDLTGEINKLKSQDGGDIIVYGGASFVSDLIKAGLIDEYYLFVNPAALGNGMTIFKGLNQRQNFRLVKTLPFDCGIVLHHYEPKKD